MGWQIRQAIPEDMSQVAALFIDSFGETITHCLGRENPGKIFPEGKPLRIFLVFF